MTGHGWQAVVLAARRAQQQCSRHNPCLVTALCISADGCQRASNRGEEQPRVCRLPGPCCCRARCYALVVVTCSCYVYAACLPRGGGDSVALGCASAHVRNQLVSFVCRFSLPVRQVVKSNSDTRSTSSHAHARSILSSTGRLRVRARLAAAPPRWLTVGAGVLRL